MVKAITLESVEPVLKEAGIGGALLEELIRRLRHTDIVKSPPIISPVLPDLASVARRFHRDSLRRTEILGHQVDDPSWNMLLAIFADTLEGKHVSTSSAVYASGVPATTGLRYVERLTHDGLLEKSDDPADGRRTLLTPTSQAMTRMERMIRSFCVSAPML